MDRLKKARSGSNLIGAWGNPQRAKARLFAFGRSLILGQMVASVFAGIALFWLWALISPVLGHALTPSIQYQHVIYGDSELQPSGGIELELLSQRLFPFSLNLSYESTLLVLGGQEAVDINLLGVGFGIKLPQRLFVLQLGLSYYFPDVSYTVSFREAMWLHINHIYPEGVHTWQDQDVYSYELHGNVGGYFKVDFNYEILEGLYFNVSVGYRYLGLMEHYVRDRSGAGYYYPGSGWVEFINYRDFSGGVMYIGITKRF